MIISVTQVSKDDSSESLFQLILLHEPCWAGQSPSAPHVPGGRGLGAGHTLWAPVSTSEMGGLRRLLFNVFVGANRWNLDALKYNLRKF